MRDAIADLVRDGDTVAIEGFTHLISFAAGHEIIRQRKRDLTLARLTPDLIYDQMIAAGVARKLVFSWLGNPGVGGLGAIRRRIEGEIPDEPLEVEEYSHFGMVGRYTAGAMNLPFFPLRSYFETDLPVANPLIRPIASPYGDETVYAVPPLRPDVDDRPRPAGLGRRRHPGLGPARLPEGGGLRRRAGHRRGRGVVDEASSGPTRTGRSSRASSSMRSSSSRGAPTPRTSRARTTATTGSTSTGTRSPATRPPRRRGSTSGSTAWTAGPPTWRSWARTGSRRSGRAVGAVRLGRLRVVPLMAQRALPRRRRGPIRRVLPRPARFRARRADGRGLRAGQPRRPDACGSSGPTSSAARPMRDGREPVARRLEPVRHRGRGPRGRGRAAERCRGHVPERRS